MRTERYGGFWRRGFAFLVDLMVIGFLSSILMFFGFTAFYLGLPPFGGDSFFPDKVLAASFGFILAYNLTILFLKMAYFTYFHSSNGQTPGKMLMGLRVVSFTGERIRPGIAFLRWAGYGLSAVVLYLGFIWIIFDERKQGWHDKIAGTLVIRTLPDMEVLPAQEEGSLPGLP